MRAPRSACVLPLVLAFGLAASAGQAAAAAAQTAPQPPGQPISGPGGTETVYLGVRKTPLETEAGGVWIFEPTRDADGTTPAAGHPLPLVLLLGGCCDEQSRGGDNGGPDYVAWIEHLVRRGAVVIDPQYRAERAVVDVVAAVRAALAELQAPDHAPIAAAKLAVVGHAYGAATAVR